MSCFTGKRKLFSFAVHQEAVKCFKRWHLSAVSLKNYSKVSREVSAERQVSAAACMYMFEKSEAPVIVLLTPDINRA